MKNFVKKRWTRYIAKKSKISIVFDFIFVLLVIAFIFPSTRQSLQSLVIRTTMFQPRETSEVSYLKDNGSNWKLRSLKGEILTNKELQGKVLFINFWATWCPPCIAEMPSIQKLYDKYGDRVEFLLISNEETSVIEPFLEKKGYSLPVYQRVSGNVPEQLVSKSIPATFLISKNGRIVIDKKGAADWDGEKVQKVIEELLAE